MKKIILVAALVTVAACSQPEATNEAAPAEEATEAAPAGPVAVDGKPSAGTFKVTDADGNVETFVGKEDGTFTLTRSNGETVTGTWTEETPGHFCQTVDGEETCSTETIVDGVWTSTDADGAIYTIERVEG